MMMNREFLEASTENLAKLVDEALDLVHHREYILLLYKNNPDLEIPEEHVVLCSALLGMIMILLPLKHVFEKMADGKNILGYPVTGMCKTSVVEYAAKARAVLEVMDFYEKEMLEKS